MPVKSGPTLKHYSNGAKPARLPRSGRGITRVGPTGAPDGFGRPAPQGAASGASE